MKQVWLSALSCFFSYFISYAQNFSAIRYSVDTIKGVVIDSAAKSVLSHVTVELQEIEKSRIIKNTLTDKNGFFEITTTYGRQLQIQFSSAGYKTITIKLPYAHSSSLHLGQVELASLAKQLEEVQVSAKKPLVEQDLDKITYNVDSDPESKTATAFEILRKVPLLTLDAEDNLQLNGNNNYKVLINGKPSSLFSGNQSDIFKNFSASAIKTIEVITVPSSRYAAEGIGGIINITTYKKTIGGYNGGINLQASSPKGYSANGNITATLGKFSFSGNYRFTASTSPTNGFTYNRLDKLRQNSLEQASVSNSNNNFQNWGGQLTYELNSLNLITLSYGNNNYNGGNHNIQEVSLKDTASELTQAYSNLNIGNNKTYGNDFGFEFQRNFKKNVLQQLAVSYKWSDSRNMNNSDFMLVPVLNYTHQASTTKNEDIFNEHNLQANYIQPIKKNALDLGANAILRQNSSTYFYKNMDTATGAFVLDTSHTNKFDYKENIYAAYSTLTLKMGKWGIMLGARLEGAKIDAHFFTTSTIAEQDYLNLIPNFTLSRQLKGTSMLKLSYTQRIQRPDLYYLDPYVDRTDPYNISYGNPNLQPALAHVFNIAYNTFIRKTFINITAFHQFTNNSIQQYTTLDADTISRTTFGNTGKSLNYNLSFSGNTTLIKVITVSLNSSANYAQYTRTISGKLYTNEGFTYTISGAANLRIKTWRFGGNMSYSAPNIFMQGRTGSYVSSSLTINRYLLKNNKVNLSLSVNSPFRTRRLSFTEIDDPTFYQRRESNIVIRRFNLSFNYRFDKIKS